MKEKYFLKQIHEMQHDIKIMLLHSFRYCLGRKTSCVSEYHDLILKYANLLDDLTIEQIIRDIEREHHIKALGMDCDEKVWLEVLEFLKKHI